MDQYLLGPSGPMMGAIEELLISANCTYKYAAIGNIRCSIDNAHKAENTISPTVKLITVECTIINHKAELAITSWISSEHPLSVGFLPLTTFGQVVCYLIRNGFCPNWTMLTNCSIPLAASQGAIVPLLISRDRRVWCVVIDNCRNLCRIIPKDLIRSTIREYHTPLTN